MVGTYYKARENFRAHVRGDNINAVEMFFMSATALSGKTVPSGIFIWNTTSGVLQVGQGSTTLKTISWS